MDSQCPARKQKGKRSRELGGDLAVAETGGMRRRNSAGRWSADCLLGGVFPPPLEISGGGGGGAAVGPSPHRARLLHPRGPRSADVSREAVAIVVRAYAAVHLRGPAGGFRSLQHAVRRAALCGSLRGPR